MCKYYIFALLYKCYNAFTAKYNKIQFISDHNSDHIPIINIYITWKINHISVNDAEVDNGFSVTLYEPYKKK